MKFTEIRENFPGNLSKTNHWAALRQRGKKNRSEWHHVAEALVQLAELALLRYTVRIRCTCNKVTTMCHKMLQVQAGENCVFYSM